MKIYFEVPYGYSYPEADGSETNVIPRKGDYMDVFTEKPAHSSYSVSCVELQVRKICFNDKFTEATVTLVEEE